MRAARAMVANKPGAPGRLRISVKTTAQGRPGVVRLHLWYLPPAFFSRRRAAGVSRRLAFPAPFDLRGAVTIGSLGRAGAAGMNAHDCTLSLRAEGSTRSAAR
ncbi:hypothetical protein BRADO3040 [Bradyrhizobium sp. ORS 278]|nr:hypothetical protein BRADO3040 [Bradyrhizobium sp. ORS 278]